MPNPPAANMTENVLLHIDDRGTATVTLNRPEVHNAFDPKLVKTLTSILQRLEGDSDVRAVVLRGAGRSFCAGADIEEMRKSATYAPEQNFEIARQSAQMFHALYALGKPTIACVHGAARGGGCGLIAACDIAIAARLATFRFSEVKIGVIPAMISPYVIAAIGERMAHRYMLTGEEFDADEAWRIGLLHEVVEADALEAKLTDLLAQLQTSGPNAVREIKRLIPVSAHAAIESGIIEETARRIAAIRATPEAHEGLSAFLEKRKPAWGARDRAQGPKS